MVTEHRLESSVSGKNPHNNKIHIDFNANRIWFEPVGMKSISYYWFEYYSKLLFIMLTAIGLPVLIISSLQLLTINPFLLNEDTKAELHAIVLGATICLSAFLISLQYFNKYWRDHYYPKVASLWFVCWDKKHKFVANPDSGEYTTYGGYRIVLPHFKNVYLGYDMTGDYAEFLSDIKVEPIYKDYPYTWNAHFIFSQVPTKGKFEVSFV